MAGEIGELFSSMSYNGTNFREVIKTAIWKSEYAHEENKYIGNT